MWLIDVLRDGTTEICQVTEEPAYNTCVIEMTDEGLKDILEFYGYREADVELAIKEAKQDGGWVEV